MARRVSLLVNEVCRGEESLLVTSLLVRSLLVTAREREREVDAPAHGSKAESDSSTARWHPHSLVVAVQVLARMLLSSGDRGAQSARER